MSSRNAARHGWTLQRKLEAAWINTIKRVARQTEEFQKSCTPGYYNNEGHVEFESQNTFYGGGPIEFFNLMEAA